MSIHSRLYHPIFLFINHIALFILLCSLSWLTPLGASAQTILQKKISLQAKNKPVAAVLKDIEQQAGFYFSYNNNIISDDSLVTISIHNGTVEQFLDFLFNKKYQFQEKNNHLIIHPAASSQYWYVSGFIVDGTTGEPVSYATVYERQQLVSTMTDEKGHFRLQLKERKPEISINVSKVSYADTFVLLSLSEQQNTKISIQQISYALDSVVISGVERTWLAKRLLSTQQTMNSLNLNNFFAKQPFQFSLTPGLGSHGRMGAQVVNKFSLNVLGGYTAGVNGFEMGSLFNIVKQDMQYLQVAGLFNIVGGNMYGVQVGGLHNNVLMQVKGVQVAGLSNIVSGNVIGVQTGGIYNHSQKIEGIQIAGISNINLQVMHGIQVAGLINHTKEAAGIQVSGLANITTDQIKGIQIAGLGNISGKTIDGIQIAGLFNKTRKLKGLQIGLINITDSSEGYSIGLINIARKGYHKLSLSTSELQHLTLAYKSGNAKLYSILLAGTQLDEHKKAYAIGYGLGSDRSLGKDLFLNPELTQQYFYNGDMEAQNLLSRLQLSIKYRLWEKVFLYAGPAFSVLYRKPSTPVEGYKSDFSSGYPTISFGQKVTGWLGWSVGIDFF